MLRSGRFFPQYGYRSQRGYYPYGELLVFFDVFYSFLSLFFFLNKGIVWLVLTHCYSAAESLS